MVGNCGRMERSFAARDTKAKLHFKVAEGKGDHLFGRQSYSRGDYTRLVEYAK
jgi:hypothetical protein